MEEIKNGSIDIKEDTLTENYIKALNNLLDNPPGTSLSIEEQIKIKSKINLLKPYEGNKQLERFSSIGEGHFSKTEEKIIKYAKRRQYPGL